MNELRRRCHGGRDTPFEDEGEVGQGAVPKRREGLRSEPGKGHRGLTSVARVEIHMRGEVSGSSGARYGQVVDEGSVLADREEVLGAARVDEAGSGALECRLAATSR